MPCQCIFRGFGHTEPLCSVPAANGEWDLVRLTLVPRGPLTALLMRSILGTFLETSQHISSRIRPRLITIFHLLRDSCKLFFFSAQLFRQKTRFPHLPHLSPTADSVLPAPRLAPSSIDRHLSATPRNTQTQIDATCRTRYWNSIVIQT